MLHHMATILVRYGFKMAAKIQKFSDLGKIWFPSRSWSCELIIIIVFGIGSKFQKDLLYGVNLIFFAPWLPWQRPPV
jgi:hypothetical protein